MMGTFGLRSCSTTTSFCWRKLPASTLRYLGQRQPSSIYRSFHFFRASHIHFQIRKTQPRHQLRCATTMSEMPRDTRDVDPASQTGEDIRRHLVFQSLWGAQEHDDGYKNAWIETDGSSEKSQIQALRLELVEVRAELDKLELQRKRDARATKERLSSEVLLSLGYTAVCVSFLRSPYPFVSDTLYPIIHHGVLCSFIVHRVLMRYWH
ncbi:hypothetical protein B0T17DRAFT_308911 [Bombardia bombarda]|uniref:Uncharacterized protein n=1 Tax=Bombardia bombarda TaxID=252184 RepID=A0AA39WVC2_9PEZI|nr:hypothetical protein B0T17DRAFT_308911 [Bombardia bombarda]